MHELWEIHPGATTFPQLPLDMQVLVAFPPNKAVLLYIQNAFDVYIHWLLQLEEQQGMDTIEPTVVAGQRSPKALSFKQYRNVMLLFKTQLPLLVRTYCCLHWHTEHWQYSAQYWLVLHESQNEGGLMGVELGTRDNDKEYRETDKVEGDSDEDRENKEDWEEIIEEGEKSNDDS